MCVRSRNACKKQESAFSNMGEVEDGPPPRFGGEYWRFSNGVVNLLGCGM